MTSEPQVRAPSPGVQHQEDKTPELFGFEDQQGLILEVFKQLGEIETLLLRGHTRSHTRIQGKISTLIGQVYLLVLKSLPERQEGSCGACLSYVFILGTEKLAVALSVSCLPHGPW